MIMLKKNARAFTLIEFMFVMSLTAILIAIAIPNYMAFKRRSAMRAAAAQLASDLHRASVEALKSEQYVWVYFYTEPGSGYYYEITRDIDDSGTKNTVDQQSGMIAKNNLSKAYMGARIWGGGIGDGKRITFGKGGSIEQAYTDLTRNTVSGTSSGYYSIMVSPNQDSLQQSLTFEVQVYDNGDVKVVPK